jgi:hypothetical protein
MKWNPLHWLGSGGSALAATVPSCPLCVAASSGLLSSLGLGALAASGVARWLVPLLLGIGMLGLVVAAGRHRVWWIPVLGISGAGVLYWGWLGERPVPLWTGISLVVAASVANVRRRRRRSEPLVRSGADRPQGSDVMTKRRIEVFTAGCSVCDEVLAAVREAACPSCQGEVRSMAEPAGVEAARRYGLERLPAVAIDGKLADCCAAVGGVDLERLRELGLGQPAA